MINKYIYLSVLWLFLCLEKTSAQLPYFHWGKAVQGTSSESITDLSTDLNGNVFIVGEYQGTIDLDPSTAVLNHTSNGLDDIFIQKLDSEGSLVWAKTLGGSGYDYGRAIAVDSDGNVLICGNFKSFMDVDPGTAVNNLFSEGGADAFVIKLDANGNFLWAKTIGDSGDDYAIDLVISSTNTAYITGGFYSEAIDLDPSAAIDMHSNNGEMDLFILELDANGDFIFGKTFGGEGREEVNGIAIDPFNSIYLTGVFEATVDFNPEDSEVLELSAIGLVDIFVEKLDNTGSLLWAKSFGGEYTDVSNGIGVDDFGNVYTAGHFFGDIDFDPDPDSELLIASSDLGETNAFIQKLDAAGSFEWVHQFGGEEMDKATATKVDGQGNIYLTGYYEGTVDFDPSIEEFVIEDAGEQDVFIQKLSSNGDLLWVKSIGGSKHDVGNAIALDITENVYVAGFFLDAIDLNPDEETEIYNAVGLDDAFVMKLSQRDLSANDSYTSSLVSLFPNPAKGKTNLLFGETQKEMHVSIKNILGQTIFSEYYENVSSVSIEVSKGIQFVVLKHANQQQVLKLVGE